MARAAAAFERSIGDLVEEVARRLKDVPHATGEARDLVAALFDEPRHWPIARADAVVDATVWTRACAAADKRASGAPLAYAVGRASFRKLTLEVDERVLIPRPETELLVDLVLERVAPGGTAVDVGTGSGAIAIALATEGEFERVIATDVSQDALDVARTNAERYAVAVELRHGDLLSAFDVPRRRSDVERQTSHVARETQLSVVVSNPPYISFDEIPALPRSVRDWEPAVALLSPGDGMAVTARLVRQAGGCLGAGGLLALEVDSRRASLAAELVASDSRFVDVTVKLDLAGRERFVLATRREAAHP